MNLSPRWCEFLQANGWDSIHWSQVGNADASDREVMQWAFAQQRIVLTHDLDYGAMLAATQPPDQALFKFGFKTFDRRSWGLCWFRS